MYYLSKYEYALTHAHAFRMDKHTNTSMAYACVYTYLHADIFVIINFKNKQIKQLTFLVF